MPSAPKRPTPKHCDECGKAIGHHYCGKPCSNKASLRGYRLRKRAERAIRKAQQAIKPKE